MRPQLWPVIQTNLLTGRHRQLSNRAVQQRRLLLRQKGPLLLIHSLVPALLNSLYHLHSLRLHQLLLKPQPQQLDSALGRRSALARSFGLPFRRLAHHVAGHAAEGRYPNGPIRRRVDGLSAI